MRIVKILQIITPHKNYVARFSRKIKDGGSNIARAYQDLDKRRGTNDFGEKTVSEYEDVVCFALCEIETNDVDELGGEFVEVVLAMSMNDEGIINIADSMKGFEGLEER